MTRALVITSSSLGSAKVMEGAGGPMRNRYPDSDQAFVENLSPRTGQVEVTRSVCLFWSIFRAWGGHGRGVAWPGSSVIPLT